MRLESRGLTVRFGAVTAFQEVDLSIEAGRVLAVLGRNASGKTSLLRALAGVLPPTAGRVLLDDRDLDRWPRGVRARRVGYLAQHPELVGGFSLADAVAFGAGGTHAGVAEALEAVGLGEHGTRPFSTLSAGQRQRGAFARLLVQVADDGVVVLDEPCSAQDPGETCRIIGLIRGMAERGISVVVAVHDPAAAWAFADDVHLLDAGRTRYRGPVSEGLSTARLSTLYGAPFVSGPEGPVPVLRGLDDRDDGPGTGPTG